MDTSNKTFKTAALARVLLIADGPFALARKLKVKSNTVTNWTYRGYVPADKCPDVSFAVDGQVSVMALLGYESVDASDLSDVEFVSSDSISAVRA